MGNTGESLTGLHYPGVLSNVSSSGNDLPRHTSGRFIAFFEYVKYLQQTRFTVRMSVMLGLSAESDAHYTQGRSKLARRENIRRANMSTNT